MSGSSFPITVVEAFTIGNKAYTGNPAAVVHLEFDDDLDDVTKQGIANTMNLSETAFISKGWKRSEGVPQSVDSSDSDPSFIRRTLRWFTPATEVPLCGHATVASAKAILSEKDHDSPIRKIEFLSLYRGILGASISDDGDDGQLITLDFPSNTTVPIALDSPWLSDFARIVLGTTGANDTSPIEFIKHVEYCEKESELLIRLVVNEENSSPLDFISKFTPDFGALSSSTPDKTGGLDIRMMIMTVQGEGDAVSESESEGEGKGQEQPRPHFYSRVLAPGYGINEDPVTGMAHTVLTSYWTRELGKDGQSVRARQASKRGGDLVCQLVHMNVVIGNEEERVTIGGRARVVLKGQINV